MSLSFQEIIAHIYPYLDLLWLPVALVFMHRGQKLLGAAFILCCAMMMRLQLELMATIGYPHGILGLIDLSLYHRGLIVYGFFTAAFLTLAFFSAASKRVVILAASITIFFTALFISSAAMVL